MQLNSESTINLLFINRAAIVKLITQIITTIITVGTTIMRRHFVSVHKQSNNYVGNKPQFTRTRCCAEGQNNIVA